MIALNVTVATVKKRTARVLNANATNVTVAKIQGKVSSLTNLSYYLLWKHN